MRRQARGRALVGTRPPLRKRESMEDSAKTKAQLGDELEALRCRVAELERSARHLQTDSVECTRLEHELLDEVLQSIDFPVYVIDADTYEIVLANRAAYPSDMPEGTTCYALTHRRQTPCEWSEGGCPLEEVKRTRLPARVEHVHYDRAGVARQFEVHAFPILDSEGRVTRVIEHNVDVTERKRVEEELLNHEKSLEMLVATLERSNQELRSFTSVAAHDIRSPMALVSSSAALLRHMLAGKLDADGERILGILIRSGQRMTAMIAALYQCSQVDSGPMSQAPVDLNRIVEEVTTLQLALDIRNSRGTIHVPERLHVVRGDEMQILQLVQNLIANGLKYHRRNIDPEITIRSREVAHGRIRFEVEDNGIGIRDADRRELFRMFKRLDDGGKHKGLGIGLAFCKKVADRHGGRIGVTSGGHAGSTFWVELPQVTEGDLA